MEMIFFLFPLGNHVNDERDIISKINMSTIAPDTNYHVKIDTNRMRPLHSKFNEESKGNDEWVGEKSIHANMTFR